MGITDKVKGALSSNNTQRHSDGTGYTAPTGTHVFNTEGHNPQGLAFNPPSTTSQTYNPATQSYETAPAGHNSHHGLSAPFTHNHSTTSQTWNPVTQSYETHTTTPAHHGHAATSQTYNPVTQSTTSQAYNPKTGAIESHTTTPATAPHPHSSLTNDPVATPAAIEPQHSLLGHSDNYDGSATARTPQNTMIKPTVAHNQFGEPVQGTSDRRPIHPDPPVHERNAMDPADTRHGSNVMTSTGAAGNPGSGSVAETALHNDYNNHRHHDHHHTLGHNPGHDLAHRQHVVHDPYKPKEDTNIREQAREYRHENAVNQSNTVIPASDVPQAIIPTTDKSGGKIPDFRGAKIVHKCDHCGIDNDISHYFRQEAVYRLG